VSFATENFKDERPLKTIGRIKDILHGLGLLPVETVWRNSLRDFFSVTVKITGTDLAANGKGVSPEYALASAYGEMMERLQNQCTFRLSFDLSPAALASQGFYYAPDEKFLSRAEFLHSGEEWTAAQLARLDGTADVDGLLALWQRMSYEEVPADFVALPYCNLRTGNISHIPVKMASKMYMSNGMCAGNTPEEALVQGISEVFERHVNQRVVREKVVPPAVPDEYLARYPRIAAMVAAIKASGDCDLIVKDCSLGRGFPVAAAVYIDRGAGTYFVKFGAHPRFEIAVERTLTELLQGQDIRKMMGMREFAFHSGAEEDPANMMGILVTGSGVYPDEFFGPRPDYGFSGWEEAPATDNRGLLRLLLDRLAENGLAVYVRDVSFLGFPSFHVVVPGFSEIESFDDVRAIEEYVFYNDVRKLLRRLDNLGEPERGTLLGFFARLPFSPATSVLDFINLPTADPAAFPWYYSNMELLRTALLHCCGDAPGAAGAFARFVEYSRTAAGPKEVLTYYRCVRDYLAARAAGRADDEAAAVLRRFFPADTVAGVAGEFGRPERILSYQGNLRCFVCGECAFRAACLHEPTEQVYLALKERLAAATIDQKRLAALG